MANTKLTKKKIANIALIAIFSAIIVAMTFTPYIGYITIPGMLSITTVHIIVIIASVSIGTYSAGAILGLVWGLSCLLYAMYNGTADAAIFLNPLISVVPRFLVGVCIIAFYKLALAAAKNKFTIILLKVFTILAIAFLAAMLCHNISESLTVSIVVGILVAILFSFLFFMCNKTKETMPFLFAAVCGTFSNTFFVLLAISLFGGNGLIDLTGTLENVFATVIALNGTIEIIAASVVAIPCCAAIQKFMKKYH